MGMDAKLMLALVEELWEKARLEADRIREEAREKARKIVEDAKKRAEALKTEKLEELRLRVRRGLYREYALKKLELRKRFTLRKSQVVKELLDAAVERALEMVERSDPRYLESLKRLTVEAVLQVGSDDVVVYCCNSRDREYLEGVLNDLIKDIEARGRRVRIKIASEPIRCRGGVLVVSADGRVFYNNTLEARIKRVEEEFLPVLIAEL